MIVNEFTATQVPLLKRIRDEDHNLFHELLKQAKINSFNGHICNTERIFFIMEGVVESQIVNLTGEIDKTLNIFTAYDMLCSNPLALLYDDTWVEPCTFLTFRTRNNKNPVQLLSVCKKTFIDLLQSSPVTVNMYVKLVAMKTYNQIIESMITINRAPVCMIKMEKELDILLLKNISYRDPLKPDWVHVNITQIQLARLVWTSREIVNKNVKKLEKQAKCITSENGVRKLMFFHPQ